MTLAHFISISYSAINQGLIWAIMVLGLYLSFRVLDYSDLTVDASLTMGAAICASWITRGGTPIVGMLLALCGGALAGMITALLHTQLKIPSLLAGILTQTSLYSINLRIMDKSFLSLFKMDTLYTNLSDNVKLPQWMLQLFRLPADYRIPDALAQLICGTLIVTLIVLFIWWFLNTEIGMAVRATGNNQRMIRALGVNANGMIVLCLMLANAIIALGGSAVAMSQSFADIQMGIGSIVIGLAGIIIGEELFGGRTLLSKLIGIVCGSIVYRLVIALVLEVNPNTNDTRLITAILVAFALSIPLIKKGMSSLQRAEDGGDSAKRIPEVLRNVPARPVAPVSVLVAEDRDELLTAFEETLTQIDSGSTLNEEETRKLSQFKQHDQDVRDILKGEPSSDENA